MHVCKFSVGGVRGCTPKKCCPQILGIYFYLECLLRGSTAEQPMTGTEGFKYQASDGFKVVYP